MKTPLKIIIVLSALLYMSEAVAQTYYYDVTKTFYESGYTYQCDIKYGAVVLYNKANSFTYTYQIYKDGSYPSMKNWTPDVEKDTWTKTLAYSIVNNAFSAMEKNRVRGRETLGITMIINPETGKVIEVYFDFARKMPYATIPVSVYRQIETELKSKIWFTPTAEGKRKNYLMRFWQQEVK